MINQPAISGGMSNEDEIPLTVVRFVRSAIKFAITASLGEACTLGGYVVSDDHVQAVYLEWLKQEV